MATKRAKRIDPNEAFASIVGTPLPEEPEAAPAPPQAPAKTVSRPAAAPPAQATAAAQADSGAVEPADEGEAPRKLVQKGYYLTEEQARQLGVYAAMLGVDRSSVVRAALDEYFTAHPVG